MADWRRAAEGGVAFGPPSAPVTMIVFPDYQCPFCKTFNVASNEFVKKHEDSLRIVFHHLPLTEIHSHAFAAALAAECANAQGHFREMTNALFLNQNEIGSASWGWFASKAAVPDTAELVNCVATRRFADRVDRDRDLAKSMGAAGTPTIILNGSVRFGAPTISALDSLYETVIQRRKI